MQLLARLVWVASPGIADASGITLGLFAPSGGGPSTALYVDTGETWGGYPSTSAGLGPFYVSEGTARVLQRGEVATDGALVYGGARYRIQALIELGHPIARAVVVD